MKLVHDPQQVLNLLFQWIHRDLDQENLLNVLNPVYFPLSYYMTFNDYSIIYTIFKNQGSVFLQLACTLTKFYKINNFIQAQ